MGGGTDESGPQAELGRGPAAVPTYIGRASLPSPTPTWGGEYEQPQVVVVEVPRQRSVGRFVFISAGIVAAFCAIGATAILIGQAFLRHSDDSSTASAVTPPPARTTPRPPAPPGLNDPVRDGMFQFTVTKVSCGHRTVSAGLISRTAQGQYCLVTLTVANIGSHGRGFAESFQKAIISDAAGVSPDSAAGLIVNRGGASVWSIVDPGETVSGTMVFDLPKAAKIAKLELHDSPLSNGAVVTL